ncbi:hypothetical protein AVEN_1724-1 [Araneus ventricosus]|uniref:Uncharacterized protein n=1 Tax=Araneus ventricosus TaxID=182803 RepID=A0A4Y2HX47_ARAVE|nr:hypothetical protein AVEN_1724-1 [Araneus ventricosus]
MILRNGDKSSVCVESVGEEESVWESVWDFKLSETRVLKTNFGAFMNDLPKAVHHFTDKQYILEREKEKPSKSMEISKMACGWNSVWTEIGTKNQRDPERVYRKEKYLAEIETSLRG